MKNITIQVEFVAQVPDNTDSFDIESITLDMEHAASIGINGPNGRLPGAVMTGEYTTTAVFEA
jgi:hypothetical protein